MEVRRTRGWPGHGPLEWPIELLAFDVARRGLVVGPADVLCLRPPARRDGPAFERLRATNGQWLGRWEATLPPESVDERPPKSYQELRRSFLRLARQGYALPFLIDLDGEVVGQVTCSPIQHGALQNGVLGYWLGREHAGRGIMPTAVAMCVDYLFGHTNLHRVEINIRPENAPSLRVVDKLGLRCEGTRQRYMYIDGGWRDHLAFAVTREEWPAGGLLRQLARRGQQR